MRSSSLAAVLLPVAVVLLAGAGAWMFFSSGSVDAGAEEVIAAQGAAEMAPEASEPNALVDVEHAPEESARVEAEVVAPDPAGEDAAEADPSQRILLAGTITLQQPDGSTRTDLSGELDCMVWAETSGRSLKIKVDAGAFEALVEPDDEGNAKPVGETYSLPGALETLRCKPRSFRADGVGITLFYDPATGKPLADEFEFPAGTADAELTVRAAPALTLHVLDAESGQPLNGVEVVGSTRVRSARSVHPRALGMDSLAEDEASPCRVPPSDRLAGRESVALLVRARGYAWQGITVDFSGDSERTIELTPSGALHLTLVGEVPAKSALRLRQPGSGTPLTEIPLRAKQDIELEGLRPGTYSVAIELGPWYSSTIVLGKVNADVVAGETASTTIELESIEGPVNASISGVLVVPPEWDAGPPRLSLQRLTPSKTGANPYMIIRPGEMDAIAGSAGAFAFRRDSLETGKYALSFGAFEYKHVFELPPEGRSDLRLEVPPPVDVTLKAVDVDTGMEATELETVSWHPKWPEVAYGGSLESVSRDAESGYFLLRVPRGPIEISTHAPQYSGHLSIPDATQGLVVTLEVRVRPSAKVELRSGEQLIPWPADFRWEVEAVNGAGRFVSSGRGGNERWFGVSEPGRYRIQIPEIDGFLPHEPVEIELVSGPRKEVVVELVPR